MDSFTLVIRAALVTVAVFALTLVRRQARTRPTSLGLWPPAEKPDRSRAGD